MLAFAIAFVAAATVSALYIWVARKSRDRARVRSLVQSYRDGRRLMRTGDGMDEWVGIDIAARAREDLNELGYDIDGTRPDLKTINR